MHVERAFVGINRFHIHEMPHDGVFAGDTIGTVEFTSKFSAFPGHPGIVAFQHGNLLRGHCTGIFIFSHLVSQKLTLGNFGEHPHQLFLYQLKGGNRFLKLNAFPGIFKGGFIYSQCTSNGTPANSVACLAQTTERTF